MYTVYKIKVEGDFMTIYEEALKLHEKKHGKFGMASKVNLNNKKDLSLAYSPGVAEPCKKIYENIDALYQYTGKGSMIAVVSDGSSVLGLGNIGAAASLPVIEGKAILHKKFAGTDAVPICLDTSDIEKLIETIKIISPGFGGIHLEDIGAPRCFEIENRLIDELNIPVYHDDQHGTAIVTVAALINSCRLLKKKYKDIKVVINGSGASGNAVCKLLLEIGVENIIMVDLFGVLNRDDKENYDFAMKELAELTNKENIKGGLKEALIDADIFIGVSDGNVLTKEMIKGMKVAPVIFALANPIPEIDPREALEAGAAIIGTGRSDYPNQINNILAFPGIFKGTLKSKARVITTKMKIAAANSLAELITDEELTKEYIIPEAFDRRVVEAVSKGVAESAKKEGVCKNIEKI